MLLQYLCLVFLQILVLRLKNLHEKKGIAQKREMLLGFFLLCYALENNDPAPTLPLGVTTRLFFYPLQSLRYRFTASLFLSCLLNQILNQLSYSVVPAPFQVHTRIIHHKMDTCQTFVCDFLGNLKKILSYPQFKGAKRELHYDESPHAAMTKGAPQAGQRGRLFAAGLSAAACFSCSARLETAVFYRLSGCISVDFMRELVCGGA